MSQETIKAGMTQGEWVEQGREVTLYTTHKGNILLAECDSFDTSEEQNKANAAAICSAVNNTYGKGINPEKVEEMYNFLWSLREMDGTAGIDLPHKTLTALSNLLNSAKL